MYQLSLLCNKNVTNFIIAPDFFYIFPPGDRGSWKSRISYLTPHTRGIGIIYIAKVKHSKGVGKKWTQTENPQ